MGSVSTAQKIFFALLILKQCGSLKSSETSDIRNAVTYDFIVVGGGIGGCVVAARLAEGGYSILLVEAGGLPNPELDVPALSIDYFGDVKNTVKYFETVPQQNAGLATNGVVTVIRGRVLGGCTGINSMIVNRGSPHDYNNWARLTGNESWSYARVLKYFRKYENYTGSTPTDQRGFNGPITVSRPKYSPGFGQWLEAGKELGYQIAEPNGPQIISFTGTDFSQRNGRRVSSFTGYIKPILQSETDSSDHSSSPMANLHILINTEVKRILFEGNRAIGVKYVTNSTHVGYAKARKEIIVSGGAIESPALLMKSGIGPKSALESFNIPVIKDLPVGKNLMDHVAVAVWPVFGNKSAAYIPKRDLTPESKKMFTEEGDGPYTAFVGGSGQAFLTSSVISPYERSLGWADMQLFPQFSNGLGLGEGVEASDLKDSEVRVRWAVYVGRPKSLGTITLDKKNIENSPLIDFQYFSHPDDMQVAIDGLKANIKICEETSAFRRIGCRIPSDVLPACSHFKFRSDPYWKCYVKNLATTGCHPSGSCKMGGGPEDPTAVVDSKLRVIGIDRLRVVDASVMPVITNSNLQAAVYMIAEKAADMILNRWEEGTRPDYLNRIL